MFSKIHSWSMALSLKYKNRIIKRYNNSSKSGTSPFFLVLENLDSTIHIDRSRTHSEWISLWDFSPLPVGCLAQRALSREFTLDGAGVTPGLTERRKEDEQQEDKLWAAWQQCSGAEVRGSCQNECVCSPKREHWRGRLQA